MQVVLSESCEDSSDVVAVFLDRVREDQDVIEVNNDEEVGHVLENIVHEVLKSSRGIGESHGHDQELKRAIACSECGLPLMTSSDADIVVACMQIKLGVDLGRAELVDEVSNEGDWVSIPSSDPIELPKIDTESKCAILFFGEENQCPYW